MPNGNPERTEEGKPGPEPTLARKPYKKPAFRYERVFETQALSCGKTDVSGPCHRNRKTS